MFDLTSFSTVTSAIRDQQKFNNNSLFNAKINMLITFVFISVVIAYIFIHI